MPRVDGKAKPSKANKIKSLWKKSGKQISLKAFAKSSDELKDISADWFFNKIANFSKAPLGLGRTRKRKK